MLYRLGGHMGAIIERKRKDGSTAYLAQLVIKRSGKIVHRENRTFDRHQAAAAWLEKRETEFAKPGAIEHLTAADPLLSDVIEQYIAESQKAIGRTKAQVLRSIKGYDIAGKRCSEIGSSDIVGFARQLADGRKPQTVANYVSHLGAIFALARPVWGYQLDQQAMKDAMVASKRMGLTSKSRERDRRPSLVELDLLMEHFVERRRRRPDANPMDRIIAFAIFSTRRLEEIIRIRWADLDMEGSRVLVRDMKNPGEKAGNHVWCDLPEPALRIALSMPRESDEIFPFGTDAIGASFTRACKVLGIDDLHFHDLRHDGVSRLFEMGRSIPQVAAVSGHRSWQSLKRYTHLRQSGDKYEGWTWIEATGRPPAHMSR